MRNRQLNLNYSPYKIAFTTVFWQNYYHLTILVPSFWHAGEGLVKLLEFRMTRHFVAQELQVRCQLSSHFLLSLNCISSEPVTALQLPWIAAAPPLLVTLCTYGNPVEISDLIPVAGQRKLSPAFRSSVPGPHSYCSSEALQLFRFKPRAPPLLIAIVCPQ